MKKIVSMFLLLTLLIFVNACTTLEVKVPSRDLYAKYSYPAVQEKFCKVRITSSTLEVDFRSQSDPLVEAMATISALAEAAK